MAKEEKIIRKDCSILFSDIHGFSKLTPYQQKVFLDVVYGKMSEEIFHKNHSPDHVNTWGDGLVAFFLSYKDAALCALDLLDLFRKTLWDDFGLPDLKIRISLHAGEVFEGYNPIKRQKELIGNAINLAARLEPIVFPNYIYATKDFRDKCRSDKVSFHLLGDLELPKEWGAEQVYIVSRHYETVDPKVIDSILSICGSLKKNTKIFHSSSKFGERLLANRAAKLIIANHCIKTDFWKSEDVVFVESGTLPIYMLYTLLIDADPLKQPKLLITNNIAFLSVEMITSEPIYMTLYSEKRSINMIITGGYVHDDFAATIPEDLIEDGYTDEVGQLHSRKLLDYFRQKGVNHIIMMVTKLNRREGPCATQSAMRRFKKLLLKYISENENAKLSILAEAEKLVNRRGFPVDEMDLPGEDLKKYWETLLSNGRVRIVTAMSPEMNSEEKNILLKEILDLEKGGAKVTLLGNDT